MIATGQKSNYIFTKIHQIIVILTTINFPTLFFLFFCCCILWKTSCRPLGYERAFLPLCKVAQTPFPIQGDDVYLHTEHQERRWTHELRWVLPDIPASTTRSTHVGPASQTIDQHWANIGWTSGITPGPKPRLVWGMAHSTYITISVPSNWDFVGASIPHGLWKKQRVAIENGPCSL